MNASTLLGHHVSSCALGRISALRPISAQTAARQAYRASGGTSTGRVAQAVIAGRPRGADLRAARRLDLLFAARRHPTPYRRAVAATALPASSAAADASPHLVELDLDVDGMTCGACSARVTKLLRRSPGVHDAAVNLAARRARVRLDPVVTGPAELAAVVARGGYTLTARRPEGTSLHAAAEALAAAEDDERVERRTRALTALPLAVLVAALARWAPGSPAATVAQAVIATVVVLGVGWPFLRGAVHAARGRSATMDTLVALGTCTALALSLTVLARSAATGQSLPHAGHAGGSGAGLTGHLHFDMACLIVAFVSLGRWIEARARASAGEAARGLARLLPGTVHRVDGVPAAGSAAQGRPVPIDDLLPGDLVLVRPGERVAVDGVVVDGASAVDESAVTGESLPVERGPGDPVTAGTLNTTGSLLVRAGAVGPATAIARLAALVEQVQGAGSSVQRLADRWAAVFVPVVVGIAGSTVLAWAMLAGDVAGGVLAAVAVLVVACPCALGLATPVALMVASGRGASAGILLRTTAAVEAADRYDVVVFDKTGALTLGRVAVVGRWTVPGQDGDAVDAAVAAAEAPSEHPVAAALVRAARDRGLPLPAATAFRALPGVGVEAVVAGVLVSVTKPDREPVPGLAAVLDAWYRRGLTAVQVRFDGRVVAAYGLADTPRPEAAAVVAALDAAGADVHLLTGDNPAAAAGVARALGIAPDRVVADAAPADKAELVGRLRAGGRRVVMVGDGINDAAALAAADVGIAVAGATDVAARSADVVLLSASLEGVPRALRLLADTRRVVLQNLGWAFGYNLVALPLAALGLLSPATSALAMGLSSVGVVANSLTLARRPTSREGAAQGPVTRPVRPRWRGRAALVLAWAAPAVLLGGLAVAEPARWLPADPPATTAVGGPVPQVAVGRTFRVALLPGAAGTRVEVEVLDGSLLLAHEGSVEVSAPGGGSLRLLRVAHARFAGNLPAPADGSAPTVTVTVTVTGTDGAGASLRETLRLASA
jgi:heavy metal translocating P-type ATPase